MSSVQPSIDPVPTLLGRGDPSPFDKSTAAGLVGMVYLARQAFEERRRKQCLEITAAILRIEPDHEEARTIQTKVRTDLDQDFASARTMVKDANAKNDGAMYGRAGATLRRIVDADPDNIEAKALLNETLAAGYFSSPTRGGRKKVSRSSILVGFVVLVVLMVSFVLMNRVFPLASADQPASGIATARALPVETSSPVQTGLPDSQRGTEPTLNDSAGLPGTSTAGGSQKPVRLDTRDLPTREANPIPAARTIAAPAAPVPSTPAVVPVVPPMGFLAVSAAVPVEIYRGDEYLGATPATLQLAAGPQTLVYRYQGVRQTLTHVIAGGEMATTTVSFPIRVQINAKPWAQVFLEGVRLTPIGQTPLGDISVPIGSVLVFQNPGFPDKKYRVTARDTSIQMSFP